jgi:hypothetical protein
VSGHVYLSTACWHASVIRDPESAHLLHARCRKVCKYCQAPCYCACHERELRESLTTPPK